MQGKSKTKPWQCSQIKFNFMEVWIIFELTCVSLSGCSAYMQDGFIISFAFSKSGDYSATLRPVCKHWLLFIQIGFAALRRLYHQGKIYSFTDSGNGSRRLHNGLHDLICYNTVWGKVLTLNHWAGTVLWNIRRDVRIVDASAFREK